MIRLTTAQHKSDTTALPDQDWFVDPSAISQILPFWGEEAAANYPQGQSIVVVAPDTEGREVHESPEDILVLRQIWQTRHDRTFQALDNVHETGGNALYVYLDDACLVQAAFR